MGYTVLHRSIQPSRRGSAAGAIGPDRGFVVEFAGQKGVGKSTLRDAVARVLDRQDLPSVEYRRLHFAARLSRRVAASCRLARLWIRVGALQPPSWEVRNRVALQFHRACQRVRARQRAGGLQLVDEGVFQGLAIAHVALGGEEIDRIFTVLRPVAPLPDLVVLVEASDGTVAERRKLRGRTRDSVQLEVSDAQREAIASLKAGLPEWERRLPGWTHVTVTNEGDDRLEETTNRLAAAILQARGQASPPSS